MKLTLADYKRALRALMIEHTELVAENLDLKRQILNLEDEIRGLHEDTAGEDI